MAKKSDKVATEEEVISTTADTKSIEQTDIGINEAEAVVSDKKATKAGKRSVKGMQEAKEKSDKIEQQHHREATNDVQSPKPKQIAPPARSRQERRAKGYRKLAELIDKDKEYDLKSALELAVKTSPTKFDATVELHVNLAVDPRHADQNIRDNLVLPSGTGKTVKIAVFSDDPVNGVDLSGIEAITKSLEKGAIDFDILISTPANMPKLGKYARLLGPRGLMPNPKSGTVTTDLGKAVAEAKAGRVEYRVDSTGIVHLGIGKVSFGTDKLLANAEAVFTSIKNNKPSSVKGNYVKAVHVTTTMGPSIKIDLAKI